MEQLLTIDIDTKDKQLATEIMGSDTEPKIGATLRINDDLAVRFEGHYLRQLGNHPDTISLLVAVQSEAVISSLVDFLLDAMRGRIVELRINRKRTELEREDLSKTIAEELSDLQMLRETQ